MEKIAASSMDSASTERPDLGYFVRCINSTSAVSEELKKKLESSLEVGDFSEIGPAHASHGVSMRQVDRVSYNGALVIWEGDLSEDHHRERVVKTLDLFRTICKDLLREGKVRRIDYEAAKVIKQSQDLVDFKKHIGSVPGVYVGDEFHYRIEAALVGLHKPPEAGIDFMRHRTLEICVSIVAAGSGDYPNDMHSADLLTYCGQGGNTGRGKEEVEDQKMEKGNLALKNNISTRDPVRVIRGKRSSGKTVPVYIYDGLYTVESFREEKRAHGKLVFKFLLKRIPGQPMLSSDQWRKLGGC